MRVSAAGFADAVRRIGADALGVLLLGPRYIRPTLEGIAFIVFTLMVGFAAMNTAAQLLYVMFALMCGFLVLSAVLANRNFRGLTVARDAPRIAEANTPVSVTIAVTSRKRLTPSFSIRAADLHESGIAVGTAFFAAIPAGETVERTYRCRFPRRGLYRFSEMQLRTRFPFSLIERCSRRAMPAEILVLPPVIDVDALMQEAASELGERELPKRGMGGGLHNIRDHQQGDSRRDIHWKVSARLGTLMVREYEAEEHRRAEVILDNRLPAEPAAGTQDDFERAVILAGSAIKWLCERGHAVSLRTGSGTVPADTGPGHELRCRRALASLALVPDSESAARNLALREGEATRIAVAWMGAQARREASLRIETAAALEALDTALGITAPEVGAAK